MPTPQQILAQNRNQNVARSMGRYPRPGAEPWYGRVGRFMPYIGPPATISHAILQGIRRNQTRGWRENAMASPGTPAPPFEEPTPIPGRQPFHDDGRRDPFTYTNNEPPLGGNLDDPFGGAEAGGYLDGGGPTVEINPVEDTRPPNPSGIADSGNTDADPFSGAHAGGSIDHGNPRQAYLAQVLAAYPSLNNPAAIRAIQNGARWQDVVGHAQFDSRAGDAMTMFSQQSTSDAPSLNDEFVQRGFDSYGPLQGAGGPSWTTNPYDFARFVAQMQTGGGG